MGEEEHSHAALRRKKALEEFRESGLPEGADGQAGQRNSNLDAGNDAMDIGKELLDDLGLRAALGDQLADAREAHRDKREFDSGKETVQGHQYENSDDPDQKHKAERTSKAHCSSRF